MISVHNIKNIFGWNKIFPFPARKTKKKDENSLFYHLKQSLRGEMYSIYFLLYEEYHFGTW